MKTNRDVSRRLGILALIASFGIGAAGLPALAADESVPTTAKDKKAKEDDLTEVVVTGSLIPQTRVETSTPVTIITSEEIEARGYVNVVDALQRASFSTGAVQGPQFCGFTCGAQTTSFFGLSPSYVKYLIDGRPIADYPALYNGTDIIAGINGIPTVLVDHIDILPGAQSSIYGSDAIAGVINVVLKKKMDAPQIEVRYGDYTEGGGLSKRLALANSFSLGPVNFTVGGQYEKTDPIWGYQRDLTNKYNDHGTSAQTAERDYVILSGLSSAYYFEDPANCGNVTAEFGGSTGLRTRSNGRQYCGTFTSGYYTLNNGVESTQGYLNASDDLTDHLQIFANVLVSHEVQRFDQAGPGFYYSGYSGGPDNTYWDTNIQDYVNIQHIFSPEEAGGIRNSMDKDTNNSLRATLGAQGSLGSSPWKYNVDWTYTQNKLTELIHMQFAAPIQSFFENLLGPQVTTPDPNNIYGQPQYAPNYANFYKPITPAQYAAFSGVLASYSQTEENFIRGQISNPTLFALPGGDAGFALEVDGGDQGWYYNPDPGYFNGESYGYTATAGSGHRSRYSGTTELRLPIVKMLTLSASGRYDAYNVAGGKVDKSTYNLGLEFRPFKQLLVRGRYGTAFKAPTLSDEFQGTSGFFETVTDYYKCALEGYTVGGGTGHAITDCPDLNGANISGTTSGNPKLVPITAKVWDIGAVWSPLEQFELTADIIDWKISNEVSQQSTDKLLQTEAACRLGELPITSPTCVAALAQVTRGGPGNDLISVYTPKQNVAEENLKVLTVGLNYKLSTEKAGTYNLEASYSDLFQHDFIRFAGDPVDNLLTDPFNSTDFKSKVNASITWSVQNLGATVFYEWYGRTPNNLATLSPLGYATTGADTLPAWQIWNASVRYDITPGLRVSFALNNVFNKQPPVDNTYTGTSNQPFNIFNYTAYGRSYYLSAIYKIGK